MSIIRFVKDKNNPYLIMNKTCLNDKRLTPQAKGILCYILSKPDNWYINTKELSANNNSGIRYIHGIIKELVKYGYMFKHRFRGDNGRYLSYDYIVYENPDKSIPLKTTSLPQCSSPRVGQPRVAKSTLLINNTLQSNTDTTSRSYIKSNPFLPNDAELDSQSLIQQTTALLYSIGISHHRKIFSLFTLSDIFENASWIKDQGFKMSNPSGFLISSIKENWRHTSQFSTDTSLRVLFDKCTECHKHFSYEEYEHKYTICSICSKKE